ncbi:glycosyltransferase family 2 protein [Hymenobacter humi]|uniref:Glycosyltransferase family 2 protein n=1 Tax=Hymenobacter humi TaxID=1411620 RepID=A0ABW2U983_9BACT
MENIPRVSVIIPSFNRFDLIPETIKSVQAQTITDWELLIVDDGSTDATREVVRSYAELDSRIRFMERSHQPKGPSSCRNIGIAAARAPYCIFLDSDDLLAPNCLIGRLAVAHAEPNIALHVFQMQFFYSQPGDTDRLFMYADANDALGSILLKGSPWGITCPLWQTNVCRNLNGFDEKLQSWEDWDLHIRAFVAGCTYKIHPVVDCFCRQGLVSLTSQHKSTAHLLQKIDLYIRLSQLFDQHKLAAVYKTRLAGKCLALCGELNEAGQRDEADKAWTRFGNEGVLTTRERDVGRIYLHLRKTVFTNQVGVLTKLLRKAFSALTSTDFAWGY